MKLTVEFVQLHLTSCDISDLLDDSVMILRFCKIVQTRCGQQSKNVVQGTVLK